MANWHTNNLTGNDTTGDGSAVNPYQTITKAVSVAAAEDTIKVAGSELSDVVGITLTSGPFSNVFTTSGDPTGLIAANDIISITHPQLGADKYFFRVISVTPTTITLNETFDFGSGLAIRKFTTPSYSSATSITFEAPNFANKRMDVTGGWNSDFTAQTGWTIASFNTLTYNANGCVFMNPTNLATNTYYERFAGFNLSSIFAGNTSQTFYGDLIATRCVNMFGGGPKTKIGSSVSWYILSSSVQSGTSSLIVNGKPAVKLENVYCINRNSALNPIQFTNITVWIVNCYQIVQNTGIGNFPPGLSNWGSIIEVLNLYANSTGSNQLLATNLVTARGALQINDINIYGINASKIGFSVLGSTALGTSIYFNTPTKNISNLVWVCAYANGSMPNLAPNIWINDIEGNKFASSDGLFFADDSTYVTGNNSLKIKANLDTVNAYPNIAQLNIGNATTSITISIIIKTDVVSASLPIVLKPAENNLFNAYTYTISGLNNTFQTKTITITDAATINNLKNGLTQVFFRNNPNFIGGGAQNIWIDSVTVAIA
jgi:hypothetical protein